MAPATLEASSDARHAAIYPCLGDVHSAWYHITAVASTLAKRPRGGLKNFEPSLADQPRRQFPLHAKVSPAHDVNVVYSLELSVVEVAIPLHSPHKVPGTTGVLLPRQVNSTLQGCVHEPNDGLSPVAINTLQNQETLIKMRGDLTTISTHLVLGWIVLVVPNMLQSIVIDVVLQGQLHRHNGIVALATFFLTRT